MNESQADLSWMVGNEVVHLLTTEPARFHFLMGQVGDVGMLFTVRLR
jgi:hypothetical protein